MIGYLNGDFREASRGAAALTEATRDGDAGNRSVQEKTVLDDPVPEMTASRPDIFYYSIVYLQYTNTHAHTDILS